MRDAEAIGLAEGRKKATGVRGAPDKDTDTRALEKSLGDRLGLPVSIAHKKSGGELRVKYTTLEQLDDICRRLAG